MHVPKTRREPLVADDARPEDVLSAIREKSRLIVIQQAKATAGKFRGDYGGAIGLQRLRRDRQALMGSLPKLQLVAA